ncbi:11054_t:CDS:2 [Entrophospora sp. SA101]|nr:11054_t:CDS:2 [Entrophospora sp. SA101]
MKYRYLFKEEKQLESALEVDKNETDNIYEELMSIGFDSLDASIDNVDDIDDFLRSLDNEPQTAKPSIKNIGKKKINTIVNNKDDDENWLDDILK